MDTAAASPLEIVVTAAHIGALLCNGMLAGVFFAMSTAVVPGLRRVDDVAYVAAFRGINRTIQNGRFLAVFFGAPLAPLATAILVTMRGAAPGAFWLLWAGAVCAVLTFVITVTQNVPRNMQLDRAPVATAAAANAARTRFEQPWARWNLARTCTSLAAFAALTFGVAFVG